jgi:G6PDH family F420-dependent oxidoreductase
MPSYGLKLMAELRSANELVDHALLAEERDLDFVSISDHIHPWLPEHEHSPFAWSVLGAIASRTQRISMITGVTCPIVRYHPVIIAHAAATVASMSGGRLTLGIGAGERLNEHVTGEPFPAVDIRHEMLSEAVEIMRQLWTGDFVTVRGEFFDADHVRIYDLPDRPIEIAVAVSGEESLDLAAGVADAIMAVDPDPELVTGWVERGGAPSATWTELPLAWAPDRAQGIEFARRFRFGLPGWDVMSELPNPKHFAAATELATDEQIAAQVPCGPDPQPYIDAAKEFLDAGFEHVALVPVGDDIEGALDFWEREVRPELGD